MEDSTLLAITIAVVVVFGIIAKVASSQRNSRLHQAAMTKLWGEYSQARTSGSHRKIAEAARAVCQQARQGLKGRDFAETADRIYRDTLQLLSHHAELKPFALEMGRLSYSSQRADKKPTIYDEQAIQNDISAHM